jgi:NADH-quinone oxidoreductase subunit L
VDFLGNLHTWAYHKFYIDEIYLFVAKKIMFGIIATSVAWFDRHIVDGFMFGVADVTMATSGKIKKFQSGNLQEYAFVFVAGSLALVLILLYIF